MTERAENCGGCRFWQAPVWHDERRTGNSTFPHDPPVCRRTPCLHKRYSNEFCFEYRPRGISVNPGAVMTRKDLLSALEVLDRMDGKKVSTAARDAWEDGPPKRVDDRG